MKPLVSDSHSFISVSSGSDVCIDLAILQADTIIVQLKITKYLHY